ncbi:hypothetical protein EHQ47_16965 [Leptospira bourretii]|uniref:PD-(D/E)XK nuclease family protein n=1 Tax=Leptospira bourretii TaxID=2484962 RepID=UPI0010916BAF|nr:PD-(D/E)XK nuclease family protein [Leptospira bourretii]TGL19788.1 hypothetical protein EHQ47_16965 [Leptospira bourretii]
MKPNLFNYGTSELTQDAFFVWLFNWAAKENETLNKELYECAHSLIKTLINRSDLVISQIEIVKQEKAIDICIKINDSILIIIEDKIHSGAHSDQLSRYKKLKENWCFKNNFSLYCVYLKTGSESRKSLTKVINEGFKVFDRSNLIMNLINYDYIKNEIFTDFLNYILKLEKDEKKFLSKKSQDWNYFQWIGFFKALETYFEDSDWTYVSNPKGGFMGFWWNYITWGNYLIYLQIEHWQLCFKIENVVENRQLIRENASNFIIDNSKVKNINTITKPNRFGNGKTMTIATVEKQNWLIENRSTIDTEKTIAKLKYYSDFLNSISNESSFV